MWFWFQVHDFYTSEEPLISVQLLLVFRTVSWCSSPLIFKMSALCITNPKPGNISRSWQMCHILLPLSGPGSLLPTNTPYHGTSQSTAAWCILVKQNRWGLKNINSNVLTQFIVWSQAPNKRARVGPTDQSKCRVGPCFTKDKNIFY